jgi:hypothetical protein
VAKILGEKKRQKTPRRNPRKEERDKKKLQEACTAAGIPFFVVTALLHLRNVKTPKKEERGKNYKNRARRKYHGGRRVVTKE